jgi:hypothetical protein
VELNKGFTQGSVLPPPYFIKFLYTSILRKHITTMIKTKIKVYQLWKDKDIKFTVHREYLLLAET